MCHHPIEGYYDKHKPVKLIVMLHGMEDVLHRHSYFDPALAGGITGGAGIKARLNQRAFQYLSTIAAGILNYYIKRTRLPNIQQCIPQLNGCINVYNLYVSRFRCPERVLVYPAPPNQIVLDVHNLDIGVTGNLGGQIVILIPIALFGIVQVNAHQVSVRVGVTIAAGPDGGPVIRMVSCAASVGFVDVFIQNGGLVGDIANAHFRGKISEMVRQQIPGQLCQRLPGIIDTEVNSKISQLVPRLIPLSSLLQIALNAFGLENLLGGSPTKRACPASCKKRKLAAAHAAGSSSNSTVLILPPHLSHDKLVPTKNGGRVVKNNEDPSLKLISGTAINGNSNGEILSRPSNHPPHAVQPIKPQHIGRGSLPRVVSINVAGTMNTGRTRINPPTISAPIPPRAQRPVRNVNNQFEMAKTRDDRATPSESGRLTFLDPGENNCENCTNTVGEENPLAFLTTILQSMDLRKLNNIFLNIQLLQTYATTRDFTIEVNGGFSVCGRGCTPFGPFPMQFPPCVNCKMVEALISDYSINSLLYHLHNTGFIRIRVGPETPKFGDLLKTTCGESEDEGGDTELEDHGVETEEGEGTTASPAINVEVKKKVAAKLKSLKRLKRQDASDLSSLGICLGDILPSVREKFPNQRVYIIISTERAPSVQLSGANGGTALINAVLNAEFHIESSNAVAGTIRIDASLIVTINGQGNRISAHANITRLNLQDVGNQLGLPQDALDNLGTLGKDILLKAANDALEKGTELNIPANIAGLPITIVNPSIHFLEHALLIQTDFTLNPNALGGYEPCPSTRTCC
uniref:BPI2 domain-containing protein n=1 Tax=Meloidogyne incognita TaxID=6306 RepID=A0A914LA55_MELIC